MRCNCLLHDTRTKSITLIGKTLTRSLSPALTSLLSHPPPLQTNQTWKIVWYSPLGTPNHSIKGMMQGWDKMEAIMAN